MYEENSLVGKVLNDRYEILEVVGSGGMATVYKAECKLLNRYVAVKVLKDSLRYDLDLKEKFNKEAQAAAKLSHNNIVSIFDVGEIDGLNYIVMEYIDGITLKEYISQNKPIHWKVARNIAIQIGMALEHAHANGIIHRDIKPHNILITKDNVIKVADFGIASAVSSETVVAGGTNAAMGSVHYISPEQARGGYVTETTDIYSLGVIMYEMVTGQLPFNGDNAISIAMMKIEKDPVNCKVINLDVPQDMAEIIMRAIARDPAARYQTVQEMLIALRKLGASQKAQTPIRTEEERQEIIKKRKEKSEKTANNRMIINVIIGTLAAIILIGVGFFIYLNGWNVKEVKVPDLYNKTLEEALVLAEEEGLKIDEAHIKYELSEDVEEGKIMEQKPGANTFVKKRKKISLVISQGATEGNIVMTSVIGENIDDAEKLLKNMGLKVKTIDREDENAEIGEVIAQSPSKGVKMSEGSTVTLYVCTSHPAKPKQVPGVIGMSKSAAEAAIKNAGFKVGNVKKETSDKEIDTVINQDPSAGSESPAGTYIDIVISSGKPETTDDNTTNSNNNNNNSNNNTSDNTGDNTATQPGHTDNSTNNTNSSDTTTTAPVAQTKNITIPLPQDGEDAIQVKVVANGKEIYNKSHQKTDSNVTIPIKSEKDVDLQVYFDDEMVEETVIKFN